MTVPADAALRFAWGLALGAMMGFCYDFLRPLRRRHNTPADALFVALSLYIWVWYGFAICAGDIRFSGTAALGLGAILWMCTFGKLLRRVIFPLWNGIFRVFSWLFLPFKKNFQKIQVFLKKVFASGKKRGTIEWNRRRHIRRISGGNHHEQPNKKSDPA